MDQEQLRKQLEQLNKDVDALMAPAPKPAPAKPQAPAATEAPAPSPIPATPAAVAPSAPAAGAQPIPPASSGVDSADWATLSTADVWGMVVPKGSTLDVDSSQGICLRTSEIWARKMSENGFENVRTEWVDAASPFEYEDGRSFKVGHKVAIGERDGKTYILDLPQTQFMGMGEGQYERVESYVNNATSPAFENLKEVAGDELKQYIIEKYGEDDYYDTRGGDQRMVSEFLLGRGENVRPLEDGVVEGTYKGIPFKVEEDGLMLKPKRSLVTTQETITPRLVEIDPSKVSGSSSMGTSKSLSKEYEEKFALPETAPVKNPANTARDLARVESAPERAPSPVSEQGGLPVPPQGEAPVSVAPTAISGESTLPPETPEKMATAATPDQGMPTDMPDFEVSDEELRASVPEATMTQDDMINMENAPKGQPTKWVRPVTEAKGRRIAVIGSAGRGYPKWDGERLTKADWDAMVEDMSKRVRPDDVLVSGGAAWADHIAVRLFLDGKVGGLILHMPNPEGEVVGGQPVVTEAGRIALRYHQKFSEKVYGDSEVSQNEILEAIEKGAAVTYEEGLKRSFFDRNKLVAKSAEDGMAAYTFDPKNGEPGDGGTADTWKSSKLAREKKRSIDIRKISPADPEEEFRVAKAKNQSDMRNIKKGDLADRTEEEVAVKRVSKLLTLGRRQSLTPQEIEGLTQRVVRALRRTPMVIDDEVVDITKATSDSPSLSSAGARMRIGDYMNSYGDTLSEVTRSGEREAFIARLEQAGIPREVLESASAGDDDARQFKPFFASKGNLTAEAADKKNLAKAKRMLAQAVADLETLRETGRLRALTHPSVAEGIDFLIRNINAYRIDMASGAMANTQVSINEDGTRPTSFFGKVPGAEKGPEAEVMFKYLEKVLIENNADPDLVDEIRRRFIPDEPLEQGAEIVPEPKEPWSFTDPDTGQKITVNDVMDYGNGSKRGYRKYAVDRTGIVPPEWIVVDQAGVDIQEGYDGGPFLNEKGAGNTTRALIGFIVEPDTSGLDASTDSRIQKRIRMAFAEYYLHRMGIHDPVIRKKMVNRGGGIDLQEYIPYTRNHATVGKLIKDKLINDIVKLGNIRVWEIPAGAGGVKLQSFEAGGRRISLDGGPGFTYVTVNVGDPVDQQLERIMKTYSKVEEITGRGKGKAARGVIFEGDAQTFIKIDPVVFQSVRHTIPIRHPEGVRFVQGGFVPAVVADGYVRRLTALATELEAAGLDATKTREIVDILSRGVFIDEEFNTANTLAATGATSERLSPSYVSSSGSPVLVLPDENGRYPDRREMIDGIRLSDPFADFETMEYPASEQTVNLDKAYRIIREVEDAQARGVDRPLSDDEVELLGRFEEEFKRSSESAGQYKQSDVFKRLTEALGMRPSIERMSVQEYDFDLQNDVLEDGPLADMSNNYRQKLVYTEPKVGQARTEGGRIFAPSRVPDLAAQDQQIVNRIIRNLGFVFRYHAARATWWNQREDGVAKNRDAAILSELANEFRRVVELSYEPNLRSAALMTGFARKVESLLGSDALAEDLWPEFVKILGSRKEVDSDRSWLDPSLFLEPKQIGLQKGDPIISLYREYVGTQIGTVSDMGERPTLGMGMVGEQVEGEGDEPEYRQPAQKTVAQEAELIPLSYFSEIETRPSIPAAPYEAVSEADYKQEMAKIDARVIEENTSLSKAREKLVELRKQLADLNPKADRYNETKMSIEGQIDTVSRIVDGFPARIKGLRDQRAKVKSEFEGKQKISKKFVVGTAAPEGEVRGSSFKRALQAIIDSSTVDGKVNTKLVANKLMVAWSVISTHYAVDRNSPITKINTNKDSTHFKYGLTMMLNAGHAIEMDLEQMFPETFTDRATGEVIDPARNLFEYLDSISDPGADETVVGDLEGTNPDEIDRIANSESFNWLKGMLRENGDKVTAVWQPKQQKLWLYPKVDLSTRDSDSTKLVGGYDVPGKDSPQKLTGTQTMTAAEAEAMIRDLGLSQVVEVVRSPGLVEGVEGREMDTGVVPYKIVAKTPAVRQGSKTLVAAGSQSVDSDSATRVFHMLADYQLRANFLGSMMAMLSDLGVDVSEDIAPKIKAITLDDEGILDLANEIKTKDRDPIGPFEMSRMVSGDEWRNSDDIVRLRLGYPEPVRRVIDDLLLTNRSQRVETSQAERDLAELIDSQVKASSVAERKPGRGKMIGYGVGGTLAGIAAGYLGTRITQGEEAAAESMPANIGFEAIGAIPKIGGPVASVAALGLTAATGGDIWRTVANLAGGLAGGAIGGAIGAIGGPAGVFAGSAALGTAGSFAADGLYTSIFGDNSPSQYTVPPNVAADDGKVGGTTEAFVDNPMKAVDSTLDQQLKIFGG